MCSGPKNQKEKEITSQPKCICRQPVENQMKSPTNFAIRCTGNLAAAGWQLRNLHGAAVLHRRPVLPMLHHAGVSFCLSLSLSRAL